MLRVQLDEGYVFDLLAIYQIKAELADTPEKRALSQQAYTLLSQDISIQIGVVKLVNILRSTEYQFLLAANKLTFRLVDDARKSSHCLAKDVDVSNLSRYNAKVALQKKFFQTEPTEIKTQ